MKFGKELGSEMVQEWEDAYMDYKHLKKVLKKISKLNALPSFASTYDRSYSHGLLQEEEGEEDEDRNNVILIKTDTVQQDKYETVFAKSLLEDSLGLEIHFFKIVDAEFNKVLRFYRAQVKEVKSHAEELRKQMDTLIALRIKVVGKKQPLVQKNLEIQDSAAATFRTEARQEDAGMKAIQEVEISPVSIPADEPGKAERCKNAALPSWDHVKINIEPNSPATTLRSLFMRKTDLSFSKEELKEAEEQLRRAFIEFYQQLGVLKSYSSLNMLGFSKIMKKYDKITSRKAWKSYMEAVDNSYLGSSDEVNKLTQGVEKTFIKHFTNGNRRKGMELLKPKNKLAKHRTTFFLGIFTGGSIALIAALVVSIHARRLLEHAGRDQYMNNIFPLYSLFGFIFLHMLVYGINTFLWRRFRVNYPFILGFKPGTELGFREILLLASGLSVLTLAAVISNLDMEMDPRTKRFQALAELVPAGLLTVLLLIIFCPINIMYRSSRFFFIRCAWRSICAPFYKVAFADHFFADQLTSQVQAIRNLQFYICYYGWGDFKRRSNRCLESDVYKIIYIVVAIIPFWSRWLQCLRRLFEERSPTQGFNSLKYFSTVVALVIRTIYDFRRGMFWKIMAGSSSGITTIFNTYWDVVMDWGLLQKKASNPWLRDKLLISTKSVYFVAIVVNILLRLVWMQLVLDFQETPFLHRKAMVALVAALEILRRGIWNFFRLENEHFNNIENYRAFKKSTLPFYYDEDEVL